MTKYFKAMKILFYYKTKYSHKDSKAQRKMLRIFLPSLPAGWFVPLASR
jgi:hypothetical protein